MSRLIKSSVSLSRIWYIHFLSLESGVFLFDLFVFVIDNLIVIVFVFVIVVVFVCDFC